jgi:hypothetical protein
MNFMFAIAKGQIEQSREVDGVKRIIVDTTTAQRVTFGQYCL